MRMPIDLHLALNEDPSIFHIFILDDLPGPAVRIVVNNWLCDYWPRLTRERAEKTAAEA